jgi:hypothetical protein
VVRIFQISMLSITQLRKNPRDKPFSSRKKSGMNAMKIRKTVGSGGQARASKSPDARDKTAGCRFLNTSAF